MFSFQLKVLCDTGTSHSFIGDFVFPFSNCTATGDCALVQGMKLLPAPVHKLQFSCSLVEREVKMAMCPVLPIPGIQVILGNDVAGACVWADAPASVVTSPSVPETPDQKVQEVPDVFPVCVVTHAQCEKQLSSEQCIEYIDNCNGSIPGSQLCGSRSGHRAARRSHPW